MVDQADPGLTPPAELKLKGTNNEHKTIVVEVRICQNPNGMIYSSHNLQDAGDERVSKGMLGHGTQAIAYGLLIEALRREAYLSTLAQLTGDKDFLTKYKDGDEKTREALERKVAETLRHVVNSIIEKNGTDMSKEVLHMALKQIGR
jgi:hypothetical protein